MEWFVARRRLRKFQIKTLCFTALPEGTGDSIKPNLRFCVGGSRSTAVVLNTKSITLIVSYMIRSLFYVD